MDEEKKRRGFSRLPQVSRADSCSESLGLFPRGIVERDQLMPWCRWPVPFLRRELLFHPIGRYPIKYPPRGRRQQRGPRETFLASKVHLGRERFLSYQLRKVPSMRKPHSNWRRQWSPRVSHVIFTCNRHSALGEPKGQPSFVKWSTIVERSCAKVVFGLNRWPLLASSPWHQIM